MPRDTSSVSVSSLVPFGVQQNFNLRESILKLHTANPMLRLSQLKISWLDIQTVSCLGQLDVTNCPLFTEKSVALRLANAHKTMKRIALTIFLTRRSCS
jgi:hypothetical protein